MKAIIFLLIFFSISCEYKKGAAKELVTVDYSTNNKKALGVIQSESKITESIITDSGILYASVKDDESNRDGFACYLCEILKENNSSINLVKIVKDKSSNDPNKDNSYGVLLGKCECK